MIDRNEKTEMPFDRAENSMPSAGGADPAACNKDCDTEAEAGRNASEEDGFTLKYPGVVPPSYFPGFPGGPSIG